MGPVNIQAPLPLPLKDLEEWITSAHTVSSTLASCVVSCSPFQTVKPHLFLSFLPLPLPLSASLFLSLSFSYIITGPPTKKRGMIGGSEYLSLSSPVFSLTPKTTSRAWGLESLLLFVCLLYFGPDSYRTLHKLVNLKGVSVYWTSSTALQRWKHKDTALFKSSSQSRWIPGTTNAAVQTFSRWKQLSMMPTPWIDPLVGTRLIPSGLAEISTL